MARTRPARPERATGPPYALSQVEPAVRAVETTEAGVAKAKARQKQAAKDAHERRNAVIGEAAKALKTAQARYDTVVTDATITYEGALEAAKTDVERANQAYAEACAVAEPLLQALRATTERVSAVAGLLRK